MNKHIHTIDTTNERQSAGMQMLASYNNMHLYWGQLQQITTETKRMYAHIVFSIEFKWKA